MDLQFSIHFTTAVGKVENRCNSRVMGISYLKKKKKILMFSYCSEENYIFY